MLESICRSLMRKQFNNPNREAEISVVVTGKEVKNHSNQSNRQTNKNPENQAINHTCSKQNKSIETLGKTVELAILRKGLFGLAMLKWLPNRK